MMTSAEVPDSTLRDKAEIGEKTAAGVMVYDARFLSLG